MSESSVFAIGAEVSCEDGLCGNLSRVVVDPVRQVLTYLVVETSHRPRIGRLVPTDLVEPSSDAIRLHCTLAHFDTLEDAEETQLLTNVNGQWGYGEGQVLALPYFGLGMGGIGLGMGSTGMGLAGMPSAPEAVTYDKVPLGDVEVRRGQHVLTTDGPVGRVRGLVIDKSDYHVTHVLLDEGHLWGEKQVAIPISAVTHIDEDGAHLNLSKGDVRDLPPVDIEHPV
ncbi:MAG TPA: PRC-barrel domain-containing protein [Acidimicrobiales bacterium]